MKKLIKQYKNIIACIAIAFILISGINNYYSSTTIINDYSPHIIKPLCDDINKLINH